MPLRVRSWCWQISSSQQKCDRVHFWPFDGWEVPSGRSVVLEVYPSLWSDAFPRERRTPDQHDAYTVARWLRETDREGWLEHYFDPPLSEAEREVAAIEGWIVGVGGKIEVGPIQARTIFRSDRVIIATGPSVNLVPRRRPTLTAGGRGRSNRLRLSNSPL